MRIREHPLPMRAHFTDSLVLTYAFPPRVLRPLLAPGLELDTYRAPDGAEYGFAAVAAVALRGLRPAFLPPWAGARQVMTGYRVFARLSVERARTGGGPRTLRGLRILRSQTSSRALAAAGSLLTRYRYERAVLGTRRTGDRLEVAVRSADGRADLRVSAALDGAAAPLPEGSPFATERDARRFAGPLPHTFEHDGRGGDVLVVKAFRTHWEPRPVAVDVERVTFFRHGPFEGTRPVLANAFHVADVDYGWHRGRLVTPAGRRG
ncbi:DUF2071 domain-containing protein [Nocardiopsis lucentensis]|uniref:DUF2071 domain-containing protein n=1 Tax=Nocardiopsis lucentensis TaxID=53441 RepID=UPI0003453705|nr:DUF2071 domain-containing protein [Nocardiopsis lucentensis]